MTSLWLTRALSRKAYIARDLQEDSVRKIKSSKTLDALAEKPAKNNSGFHEFHPRQRRQRIRFMYAYVGGSNFTRPYPPQGSSTRSTTEHLPKKMTDYVTCILRSTK